MLAVSLIEKPLNQKMRHSISRLVNRIPKASSMIHTNSSMLSGNAGASETWDAILAQKGDKFAYRIWGMLEKTMVNLD